MADQNDAAATESMDSSVPGATSWEARFKGLQNVVRQRTQERDDYAAQLAAAQDTLRDAEDRYRELEARLSEEEEAPSINLADRPRRPLPPSEKPDSEKSKQELLDGLRGIPWPDEWGWR